LVDDFAVDLVDDFAVDLGEDLGDDLGEDLGEDLGDDLGDDLGEDLGDDFGEDLGDDFGEDLGDDFGEDLGEGDFRIDLGDLRRRFKDGVCAYSCGDELSSILNFSIFGIFLTESIIIYTAIIGKDTIKNSDLVNLFLVSTLKIAIITIL